MSFKRFFFNYYHKLNEALQGYFKLYRPEVEHCGSEYWKQRWVANDIRFHKEQIHPMLEKHLDKLIAEKKNARILFPLCGKSLDMIWLASLGHQIVGIELAKEAMEQFFSENKIEHKVEDLGDFKLYKSLDSRIKLYQGDFFKYTPKYDGYFECVWDRASFVALPPNLRIMYANHIQSLLASRFRYLLDVFEYDQSLYDGPPFCITVKEITELYGQKCKIKQIDSNLVQAPVPIGPELVGDKTPYEYVYLLTNK